jgi:hypothetical protein
MSITRNSGFKPYDKSELFEKINAIDISQNGNQVITKYFDAVINTTSVSGRYEIFDIRNFLKNKITQIEENFKVSFYKFVMKRGVQELTLLSDKVDIYKEIPFYKSFFILNSTDKSRKLNINLGLYRSDNNSYFISSIKNLSFSKKHLKGVTQSAEDASESISGETFDDQINSIKSLVGESILFSNVKSIIVDDEDLKINHRKFDAFKNSLMYSYTDKVSNMTNSQISLLRTQSEKILLTKDNDFPIDAFKVFNCYMQVFSKQDSFIVKKETEKIMKITQCFIRNEKLNKILDLA